MSENLKISKFNIQYPSGDQETAEIQIPLSAVRNSDTDTLEQKLFERPTKTEVENSYRQKDTSITTLNQIYGKSAAGDQLMFNMSNDVTNSTIVVRTTTGQIRSADPVNGVDTVNLKYANNNFIRKLAEDKSNYRVITKNTHNEYVGLLLATNSQRATTGSIAEFLADGNITTEPTASVPTKTPTVDYAAANKKYVDNATNKLKEDIEIIEHVVLPQTGILVSDDIVEAYDTRITAQGRDIIDGHKAILKKVVGNTVACKNIWNGTWELGTINTNTGEENTSSDSLVSSFVQVNGGETIAISGNLAELYMCFVYDKDKNFLSRSGWSAKTLQVENNGAFIRIMQYQSTVEPTNVQVEYGTTATEYQPYFTGLKSANFAGIESGGSNLFNGERVTGYYQDANFRLEGETTPQYASIKVYLPAGTYRLSVNKPFNIVRTIIDGAYKAGGGYAFTTTKSGYVGYSIRKSDNSDWTDDDLIWITAGTEETEYTPYIDPILFSFPKTETPLGVTIDFESKKITDYGYTIVLKGTEVYSNYNSTINGVATNGIYVGVLPNAENNNQNGVTTDGIITTEQKVNRILIGAGNSILYWVGILDILGFTTAGTPATGEEVKTALANFKAWLAQRYADGNPVTIRYVSTTLQSESNFTDGNEYTAYKGGTETVLDNDGAEYGAAPTVTTNYLFKVGGNE